MYGERKPGARAIGKRRFARRLGRGLLARIRFYGVLVEEFWGSLALFFAIAFAGGLALVKYHEAARGHSLLEGMYDAITMMFLQPSLPYPPGPVQVLYFALPLLGIALVAEPVARFFVLVFNKENRLEDWYVALASTYSDHFIVCGLGNIGFRVVLYLERLGKDIVAVEKNPEGPFVSKVQERGIPVVIGDPRRGRLLEKLCVAKAKAVLALTNDDLVNLEICLDARQLRPDIRVVLRMFDDALAAKVQKAFGIQVAFSSSALAGPAFAAASTSKSVRQSFQVEDDIYHVAEITVRGELDGKSVGEAEKLYPCSILAVLRANDPQVFPLPEQLIAKGDRIVAAAALSTIMLMEGSV